MNKGHIEQIGSPREIYNEPATSFAYSFIGTVNEFRGRVEGEYLRVGNDLLPLGPHTGVANGSSVVAFARPHDTEIVRGSAAEGVEARVNRILSNGAITRVELLANGAARGGKKDYFEVEVSPEQLAALGLSTGESVRIKSKRLSLFGDQK